LFNYSLKETIILLYASIQFDKKDKKTMSGW